MSLPHRFRRARAPRDPSRRSNKEDNAVLSIIGVRDLARDRSPPPSRTSRSLAPLAAARRARARHPAPPPRAPRAAVRRPRARESRARRPTSLSRARARPSRPRAPSRATRASPPPSLARRLSRARAVDRTRASRAIDRREARDARADARAHADGRARIAGVARMSDDSDSDSDFGFGFGRARSRVASRRAKIVVRAYSYLTLRTVSADARAPRAPAGVVRRVAGREVANRHSDEHHSTLLTLRRRARKKITELSSGLAMRYETVLTPSRARASAPRAPSRAVFVTVRRIKKKMHPTRRESTRVEQNANRHTRARRDDATTRRRDATRARTARTRERANRRRSRLGANDARRAGRVLTTTRRWSCRRTATTARCTRWRTRWRICSSPRC